MIPSPSSFLFTASRVSSRSAAAAVDPDWAWDLPEDPRDDPEERKRLRRERIERRQRSLFVRLRRLLRW